MALAHIIRLRLGPAGYMDHRIFLLHHHLLWAFGCLGCETIRYGLGALASHDSDGQLDAIDSIDCLALDGFYYGFLQSPPPPVITINLCGIYIYMYKPLSHLPVDMHPLH